MISLILAQKKMLKLITFDLDDTLWDVRPTLINAEKKTREFIVGSRLLDVAIN